MDFFVLCPTSPRVPGTGVYAVFSILLAKSEVDTHAAVCMIIKQAGKIVKSCNRIAQEFFLFGKNWLGRLL